MTTLQVHSAYCQSALWLAMVGVGSGMFNSPNTAAMMGVVPAKRRGIAAGARTLLQNTGAVLSIAFVLAIVTSSIPKSTLFAVFSGLAKGLSAAKLDPFIANMHVALWALSAVSLLGAGVCLLRPAHDALKTQAAAATVACSPRAPRERGVSAQPAPADPGDAARGRWAAAHRRRRPPVGTTPRTIRYYEELGLLARPAHGPPAPTARYSVEEVERLREIMRLKELLGLSLEELGTLLAAEEARAAVRAQLRRTTSMPAAGGAAAGGARAHRPSARAGPAPGARSSAARGRAVRDPQAGKAQAARAGPRSRGRGRRPRASRGSPRTMTSVPAEPSPAGVPGAVTDTSGLEAQELTFTGGGGTAVNGYLASPSGDGPRRDDRDPRGGWAERAHPRHLHRLAALGYGALGVDLDTREGGPPPAGDVQALMERLFSIPDDRVLGDLEGAADHLRGPARASGPVGCIGFCMGGRYTLLMAVASDRLDAAVHCWGGFIERSTPDERSTPERPTPPLELAGQLHCPLLAAIGAEDQNPSPEIAERLLERASCLRPGGKVDVYKGAGHAFLADYRPTYRPEPAARLWEQIVPFLSRHLQED